VSAFAEAAKRLDRQLGVNLIDRDQLDPGIADEAPEIRYSRFALSAQDDERGLDEADNGDQLDGIGIDGVDEPISLRLIQ